MNWEDEGYIISKNKFRENAIILDVFTSNYGKVSGIVYGGNSRKIRNYLQLFNKIFPIKQNKLFNNFKSFIIINCSNKSFDRICNYFIFNLSV